MPKPHNERTFSCVVLSNILQKNGSLAGAFQPLADTHPTLNPALIQEYCFGVCRWYLTLDFWAKCLLSKPLKAKDCDLYCLILLGLYQLHFMRTPSHAAVNETVAAVDLLGKQWARGLVNAVLRNFERQQQALLAQSEKDYSIKYSHPQWLLDQLKADWPRDYRDVLDANNQRAPMTLRLNLNTMTRAAYLDQLAGENINANAGLLATTAIILDAPCDVRQVPGFNEGYVSIQDEASQLVAQLLPLHPGLRVLDACSAPGGKACAVLEAEPELHLLCLDNESRRLPRIIENLERCNLSAITQCADITQQNAVNFGQFDRIMLDVPCSSTGVIRRHPDIKLLRTPEDIAALVLKQSALLDAAWQLLVPGGYLIYSTCSILKVENSHQIEAFSKTNNDCKIVEIDILSAHKQAAGLQLLPKTGHNDGFYYALLQKC